MDAGISRREEDDGTAVSPDTSLRDHRDSERQFPFEAAAKFLIWQKRLTERWDIFRKKRNRAP
jgi:hypothetical protein